MMCLNKAVEVKNVVKVYGGVVRALNGVDLDVDEGSVYALLGPNGAGKTTLIRVMTTQLRPNEGYVKVFGYDVVNQASKVRELIGYVPQEVSLWSDLTGYENLLIYAKIYGIPKDVRKRVVEEVLDFMGLKEAANRLVRTYSGGMIRRLEIASAVMVKPKLMVLDEPTIGLDPSARKNVWERIISYKKEFGVTVFFATHYMDEADKYADRISLMSSGKIITSGTPEELKALVGGDKVLLKVSNVSETLSTLSKLNYVVVSKVNNGEVEFIVNRSAEALPKVLKELMSNGVEVDEIKIHEASLDEVFIKLTGRSALQEVGRIREVISARRMIRRGG